VVQSPANVSRVNPAWGEEMTFNHDTPRKGSRGIGDIVRPLVVLILGSLAVRMSFKDEAEPLKKGTATRIPITKQVAIVMYKGDLFGRHVGAAGFIIVGFSLRTDLKLSRKRDWCVTTRKLTWI